MMNDDEKRPLNPHQYGCLEARLDEKAGTVIVNKNTRMGQTLRGSILCMGLRQKLDLIWTSAWKTSSLQRRSRIGQVALRLTAPYFAHQLCQGTSGNMMPRQPRGSWAWQIISGKASADISELGEGFTPSLLKQLTRCRNMKSIHSTPSMGVAGEDPKTRSVPASEDMLASESSKVKPVL